MDKKTPGIRTPARYEAAYDYQGKRWVLNDTLTTWLRVCDTFEECFIWAKRHEREMTKSLESLAKWRARAEAL